MYREDVFFRCFFSITSIASVMDVVVWFLILFRLSRNHCTRIFCINIISVIIGSDLASLSLVLMLLAILVVIILYMLLLNYAQAHLLDSLPLDINNILSSAQPTALYKLQSLLWGMLWKLNSNKILYSFRILWVIARAHSLALQAYRSSCIPWAPCIFPQSNLLVWMDV